jgi:PIN domain nuclease of toxin-antitoxin system
VLLLDTHVLLWLVDRQEELSSKARRAIGQNPGRIFISSITGFEIALKAERGALELPLAPAAWTRLALERHGIEEIPVTCEVGALAASLPRIHRDPCDRIIIATAKLWNLTLWTKDATIAEYPDVITAW